MVDSAGYSKIELQYLHNIDSYYIPSKEIYIKRWMFLYADPTYLASMIGVEHLNTKERDELFLRLAQEPESQIGNDNVHY